MAFDLQNMLELVMSLALLVLVLLLQQPSWSLGQQEQSRLSSWSELSALYSLRSSLGLRSRDWPRRSDPCSRWVGVHCEQGRVVSLNLNGLRRTRLGQLNPDFSVDALSNLTLLSTFNTTGFYLPGPIPNLSSSITILDLRFSSIIGTIPPSLLNIPNLTHLYLSGNALTGNIPQSLSQLSSLSVLDLSANSLVGSIPSSLSSLTNLTILDLSANFLSGPIPTSLGNLSTLTSLILSNNSLTGSIPSQLSQLSRLLYLDLGFNSLSGSTPQENVFSALTQLQSLVLTHNNFSGTLPSQLWSFSDLHLLDISYNNFTGEFSILNFNATAAIFNISHNQFYGQLPPQLWRFGFINLSGNYFQGSVPEGNSGNASFVGNCLQEMSDQRTLGDCESFYAVRGLNFDGFGTPNTTNSGRSTQKNSRRLRFILAGVFGGLGFIVFVVLVLALFLGRRKRAAGSQRENGAIPPAPSGGGPPPPAGISINLSSLGESFTYEQLLRATADFSDSNLIKHGHTGDLYQGILEGGIVVVVKRIDVHAVKRDAYMVELDFFSRASHTRLVPLLGHCLESENEKLLVYKYMPNGDLSNALYRKTSQEEDSLQSLDWITRLKIATGAAEALSYLHHDCTPPLVHRDVQASSILLDDKFEVRLGSLCEICTQEGDTHQNVITRLLRLSQTSEQGLSGSSTSTTTCAYDVFCLGKVLLELVTGKMGISGSSNDTSMNELLEYVLPCISIYDKESVTKIVDPSLIVDEDLLEEVWAMAIVAKSCLNPKPSKRPLMRYILKALENPLKVVREENSSSARLRTMSSRGSWNAAIFGSWRHSSSDIPGPNREGTTSSLKQSGDSQGSGGQGVGDLSSSNKRVSKEIFPEPLAFGRDAEGRAEDD